MPLLGILFKLSWKETLFIIMCNAGLICSNSLLTWVGKARDSINDYTDALQGNGFKSAHFLRADVYKHYCKIKQLVSRKKQMSVPRNCSGLNFSKGQYPIHLDHMVTWYCALWFLGKVYFHDETVIYFFWYLEHRVWSFKKVIPTEAICDLINFY